MTPEQLAHLQQKLSELKEQRALLEESPLPPQGETSASQTLEARLADLKAQRAQLEAEDDSGSHEYSYWDRAKQFGTGALSAMTEFGANQALSDPFTPSNTKKYMQDMMSQHHQAQEKELNELDPTGRILHHAGGFGGGMLGMPIPTGGAALRGASTLPKIASAFGLPKIATALGRPSIVPSLGKDVLMGAGIGAASGTAQELGANPLAADIGAALLTPGAVNLAKKTGKMAAYPLSPAIRKNVAEEAGKKEASKILQKATQNVPNSEEAINLPKALHKLEPRSNAEETGTALRKSLTSKLEKHEKTRKEITQPLYEKVEKMEQGLRPVQTETLLEKELKTAKGSIRDSLAKVQKELKPNTKVSSEEIRNQKVLELYKNKNFSPQALDAIRNQFPIKGRVNPKPIEIENTIKYVSDEINKAYRTGATKLAKKLEGIKSSLEEDFKSLPEGLMHREKYAELSKPISAIKEHRTLGKVVEKGEYGKGYKLSEAEIPKEFVTTSMKSVQDSKDLLKQIQNDKKTMSTLHGYINNEILEKVTDDFGKVSLSKLESWRKSHPGAFILYPNLETKLKNISNAQYLVNQIETTSKNLPSLEAFQALPIRFLKKFTRKVVGGDILLNFIHKFKDTAKTQKRDEWLQKALADPNVAKLLLKPMREQSFMEKLATNVTKYAPRIATNPRTKAKED